MEKELVYANQVIKGLSWHVGLYPADLDRVSCVSYFQLDLHNLKG